MTAAETPKPLSCIAEMSGIQVYLLLTFSTLKFKLIRGFHMDFEICILFRNAK
jgi:hypothetical protein